MAESKKPSLGKHQARVVDKHSTGKSLVVAHSLGSGKTLTGLSGLTHHLDKNPNGYGLVLAPASLVSNIDKELEKHNLSQYKGRIKAMSFDKGVNNVHEYVKDKPVAVLVDEAHKLRNTGTKRHQELGRILKDPAIPKLFTTATPEYNEVTDVSVLVNLAAGKSVLPQDKKTFEDLFIEREYHQPGMLQRILGVKSGETLKLKNHKKLKQILNEHVDYYDALESDASKFPTLKENIVKVPMSTKQKQIYDYVEGDLPFLLRMKVRSGIPLDKQETAHLNAFSSGVRQVSNSLRGYAHAHEEDTPKITHAVTRVKHRMAADKNFKAVVYSNFLQNGLDHYEDKLKAEGVPYAKFTGKVSKAEKDKIVKDFNSGKTKVLLLSSSGGEGLDLKGVKYVQIMDPHFNKSKIKQVVGRAQRYESHAHLPENERHVDVDHFLTVRDRDLMDRILGTQGKGIDEYLHERSEEKDRLNQEVRQLMKSAEFREKVRTLAKREEVQSTIDDAYIGATMGGIAGVSDALPLPEVKFKNKYAQRAFNIGKAVGAGAAGAVIGSAVATSIKNWRNKRRQGY